MTTVTAKVRCATKAVSGEGDSRYARLEFQPDYQDGRNKAWSLATPHLSLTMTVNGDAANHFDEGQNYTLEFTPNHD